MRRCCWRCRARSGRLTSGDKACICKLRVNVDGEDVSTSCAGSPPPAQPPPTSRRGARGRSRTPAGSAKLVRELTTFRSLSAFQTFFDVALDGQGCTRAGRAGQAARLNYWYAPKHNGSASAAASARAPADGGKWPQQLNPLKPGGLDSPFEACFLTMATLRLGLSADDAAVLFGISSGSASIIFNTWVPFISRALRGITPWPDGATVAARLPEKFKTKLARTTHSKRCRIIIDCTEFEIQTPNDDTMRKLY